ncbi:hypothetical protein D9M71_754760 [compost metagenome]
MFACLITILCSAAIRLMRSTSMRKAILMAVMPAPLSASSLICWAIRAALFCSAVMVLLPGRQRSFRFHW